MSSFYPEGCSERKIEDFWGMEPDEQEYQEEVAPEIAHLINEQKILEQHIYNIEKNSIYMRKSLTEEEELTIIKARNEQRALQDRIDSISSRMFL